MSFLLELNYVHLNLYIAAVEIRKAERAVYTEPFDQPSATALPVT
jgi:hypothetical protein